MWAQLIKMRVKAGRENELAGMFDGLQQAEQPGSGLLRTVAMQEQGDPRNAYVLVVFESEEKARAREKDPRRSELLKGVQATMAEMFDGPPEFTDLTVVRDVSG